MFNENGENKTTKETREDFVNAIKELKGDFKTSVKDKKRWLSCSIEVLIVLAIIGIDLLTKYLIYGHCATVGDIVVIKNFIIFTAVKNTGASFGILQDQTLALTILSTICAIFLIGFIFYSYKTRTKLLRIAIIMITAGAIGNIFDRYAFGYVRDFIFAIPSTNFPVFNVADSMLTIGTILLLIYILFFMSKDEDDKKKRLEKETNDKVPTKKVVEENKNSTNEIGEIEELFPNIEEIDNNKGNN
ncbi:MAG: signal peptidase II [Clostridia bacterium]